MGRARPKNFWYSLDHRGWFRNEHIIQSVVQRSKRLSRNSEKRCPYCNVKDQIMNLFLPLDVGCVSVKPGTVIDCSPRKRISLRLEPSYKGEEN